MTDSTIADLAQKLDTEGMLDYLRSFIADLRGSFERLGTAGPAWVPSLKANRWKGILCLGMGGSAAGGSALASLAAHEGVLPVNVHRDHGLPSWWEPEHLIIATSYSGNTEETLDAVRKAISEGGTVISICSGGELAGLSELHENAHLVLVPSGQPPRSAFGHLFGTQLSLAWSLGLFRKPKSNDLEDMLNRLQTHVDDSDFVSAPNNDIALLAAAMVERPIAIIGPTEMSAVVDRFTSQLNENSARFARGAILPEMNHNEIIAWGGVGPDADPRSPEQALLLLTWGGMHHRIVQRFEWFSKHLSTEWAWKLNCEGRTLLEAILYSCVTMDWLSCALALLHGKNPTAIGPIIGLKEYLASIKPD